MAFGRSTRVLTFCIAGLACAQAVHAQCETEELVRVQPNGEAADHFGHSVALKGNTAVVGAPYENGIPILEPDIGAAYAYTLEPWGDPQRLVASDRFASDRFGSAVAVDGDTLVVGASGRNVYTGGVYVFERQDQRWTETAILTAPDGDSGDQLGFRVAISGSTILASAFLDDNQNGIRAGAVYVFEKSDQGWQGSGKLIASDGARGDQFGGAIDIHGNVAVIGANATDMGGTVYIFERISGQWTETQVVTSPSVEFNELFGTSVAISTNTILVGAPNAIDGGGTGLAYVLENDGQEWVLADALAPLDPDPIEHFGYRVDVQANRALVGSIYDTRGRGSATLLVRDETGAWITQHEFTGSDSRMSDSFSFALAIDGERGVIGAFGHSTPRHNAGAAYFFDLNGEVDVLSHPQDDAVLEGDTLTLSVDVEHSGPANYQWRRHGIPLQNDGRISGVNTSALLVEDSRLTDQGEYDVVVIVGGCRWVSYPASVGVLINPHQGEVGKN